MKSGWLCFCVMAVSASLATAADLSAADLVDEAIWWPGDFAQVCRGGDSMGPFTAPRIRAYAPLVSQDYFLSKPIIERLKTRKAEVSAELVKRLKAFDWEHVPKPTSVSKRVNSMRDSEWNAFVKANADGPGPGQWIPQNTKALGGAMLRIIAAVDAAETLPELLRLETQLDQINQKAVEAWRTARWNGKKVPAVYLPKIELGGRTESYDEAWDERNDFDNPKLDAWRQWTNKLHDSLVFQTEILGVSLGILDHAGYEPLKDSVIGRLRNLGLRREGLRNKEWLDHASKKDAEETKSRVKIDPELGVPLYPGDYAEIPAFDSLRATARILIQAFSKGEKLADRDMGENGKFFADIEGKPLLDALMGNPGKWSQMCSFPPPIPLNAPLVPTVFSVERFYAFNDERKAYLMASRNKVGPVVIESLGKVHFNSPAPVKTAEPKGSGQSSAEFGPLLLQTVQILNLVEALPQVVRLEEELHQLIAKGERDPKFEMPRLNLDSPVGWVLPDDFSPEQARAAGAYQRISGLFAARLFQREMLALISQLMEAEEFEPYLKSPYRAALKAAGREQLQKKLKGMDKFKSHKEWSKWVDASKERRAANTEWDDETHSVIIPEKYNPGGPVPYSEASREALKNIVNDYLKSVPADKRKAADGMHLFWLDHPRY